MTQIVNYSEKAIAVIGDTKEIKDQLKAMGGKFNKYLKCGAGWIFSATKRAQIEAFLNQGAAPQKSAKKSAIDGWRIYVGTYGKYAAGSIAGGWLTLSDYANKDEFIAACKELHKDETDPEFMFQDAELVPSWLWGESFVDAEIWNYKEPEQAGKQTTEEKAAILAKYYEMGEAPSWAKSAYVVIEAGGHCFVVEKPSIETKFCHPDEPAEEVKAWWKVCRTYEYFERENLATLTNKLAMLEKPECYIWKSFNGLSCYETPYYGRRESNAEEMTPEIRQALISGVKSAIELHRKRLQTWWKKYGADKLHCWTYWADR